MKNKININIDVLTKKVEMSVSRERFEHILRVEKTAVILANKYGYCEKKTRIAALIHDYAKERSDNEFKSIIHQSGLDLDLLNWGNSIWHGVIGEHIVKKELGIKDKDILQSIRVHTTGSKEMSILDKIIYLADYIEPERKFSNIKKLRIVSQISLDEAIFYCLKYTIKKLISRNIKIYPKTIDAYNHLVEKI